MNSEFSIETKQKNVLFIMADQLAAAQIGCYGSGVPSTPTLDALAADGVRFNRCYASTPVCAPSRANILTGRSPCVHGLIKNNYCLATDMPTYAHVLKNRNRSRGSVRSMSDNWRAECSVNASGDEIGQRVEFPHRNPFSSPLSSTDSQFHS